MCWSLTQLFATLALKWGPFLIDGGGQSEPPLNTSIFVDRGKFAISGIFDFVVLPKSA